jgi:hypothetical protein
LSVNGKNGKEQMKPIEAEEFLRKLEADLASVTEERQWITLKEQALHTAVQGLRNVVNVNGGGKIAIPREKPLIKKNAFVHMGIAEATIHYLRLAGTNQKHRQIVEALLKGGKQSNAKRFTDAVRSILNREAQSESSPLYWSGKDWGLKDMIISREEDLQRFHS